MNYTLPLRSDRKTLRDAADPLRAALAALLPTFTPSQNEAQTEDGWIKLVLKALGHHFEVQPSLKTPEGTKKPDYVFYCRSVFAAKANGYYEVQPEPLSRFPVPNASSADQATLGTLAQEITAEATARYALHEKVRHRLRADLGTPSIALNQKLTAWWTLDFARLQAELGKVFQKTIPVKDRERLGIMVCRTAGRTRSAHCRDCCA